MEFSCLFTMSVGGAESLAAQVQRLICRHLEGHDKVSSDPALVTNHFEHTYVQILGENAAKRSKQRATHGSDKTTQQSLPPFRFVPGSIAGPAAEHQSDRSTAAGSRP